MNLPVGGVFLGGIFEFIMTSFPPNFMKTVILQTQEVQ